MVRNTFRPDYVLTPATEDIEDTMICESCSKPFNEDELELCLACGGKTCDAQQCLGNCLCVDVTKQ